MANKTAGFSVNQRFDSPINPLPLDDAEALIRTNIALAEGIIKERMDLTPGAIYKLPDDSYRYCDGEKWRTVYLPPDDI